MAIQLQGNSGVVADIGGTTLRGQHIHIKPLEFGSLGHYGYSVRISSTAAQAANSRIFEIRNTHATNLIIPTRLTLRALQTAAGTAQENSIDVYKATSFSAVDTTNTVTPTQGLKRASNMAAFPGGAAVRHLTVTGAAAGMTGGTVTKDALIATLPYNVAAAISTTFQWGPVEAIPNDGIWEHPWVFAQNEGLVIENRVLNVTSYGITWFIDFAWAEVTAF